MKLSQLQEKRLDIVFEQSKLSEEEKESWMKRFDKMPAGAIEAVLDLFELLPSEIKWFTAMQERKESALSQKNHDEWESIVEEEKNYLSKLSD
ncbi:hypothetical protein ACFLY5_00050 [Patescibacteria group bacterium]